MSFGETFSKHLMAWQPLRIEHKPDSAYIVIYNRHPLLLSMGSHHVQQENNSSLSVNTPTENKQAEEHADNQMHSEAFPHLAKMYEYCTQLYQYLESSNYPRMNYLKWYANARYYRSMMKKEIKRLNQAGVKAHLDGKDQEQIFEEFRNLEEQVPEQDYQNICWNVLHSWHFKWDCEASSLFIALPSDLNSWNELNPSTHRFRLYFLCQNWKQDGTLYNVPQYVHFSNHPGYDIQRPQEFCQTYGDHMLRLLQMVKHGYSGGLYEIPSLDTFKILWNCDPDIVGYHVTKETLRPLVDKATTYLQELSPPKVVCQALTPDQLTTVKTYLDVNEGDDGENNLNHYISSSQFVLWLCPSHMKQRYDQGALDDLNDFVLGRGRQIDMCHSTLRVELGSSDEADRFCSLLTAAKHVFGITIKLNWKATRLRVKGLCLDIAKIGTVTLAIDGITLDIHPQGQVQYKSDLFSDEIMSDGGLQLITLLNYPQPQEQRLHFDRFSLQLTLSQAPFVWLHMRDDMVKWCALVRQKIQEASDFFVVARKFHAVLEKHELSDVSMMTIYTSLWDVVFDVTKCIFIDLSASDRSYPNGIFAAGNLQQVTFDITLKTFDLEHFFRMVQANEGLQELNIMYLEHSIHDHAENIVRIWRASPQPFRLNLLEWMDYARSWVFAQLTFAEVGGERIQVLEWDCDHAFGNYPTILPRSWTRPYSSVRRF
ncbi:hypothetical protein MVEG_01348 [Podila verticillata NRRL 6337]|nr:hypothetical protein MVEG_01348 [Podila verticillata NRRL 6337]